MQKIDFHCHILPDKWPNMKERSGYSGWIELHREQKQMRYDDGRFFRNVDERLWSIEERLKQMDKTGVTTQVLSIVPVMFSYWAKVADAEYIARYMNDYVCSIVNNYPDKFFGLATLPLQSMEATVAEMKRCKALGFSGIFIGSHLFEKSLDLEYFHPLYKCSVDLDLPIFVHPWDMPKNERTTKFMLPYLTGMTYETTNSICSMIFGECFEKFPQLKVCFAHGGGYFPYILGRAIRSHETYPEMYSASTKSPETYLKNIYVDTLLHSFDALQLAMNVFSEDHLMMGSDYPFLLGEDRPGQLIEKTKILNDDMKEKLLFRNAMKFLNKI